MENLEQGINTMALLHNSKFQGRFGVFFVA